MPGHVFVDETKAKSYVMAAAVFQPSQLDQGRRRMRSLLTVGRNRLHFNSGRDRDRKLILIAITEVGAAVTLYEAHGIRTARDARDACLTAIAMDAALNRHQSLVLETDTNQVSGDRRTLYLASRKAGVADHWTYRHVRAHEECLLWIPDAVAWCWARGGDWKRRVMPMISDVIEV